MDWKKLFAVLRRKSTWLALAGLAGLFGLALAPEQIDAAFEAVSALLGIIESF